MCNTFINPRMQGFVLALRHLLVLRLPLYTLMHRFRPLAFLPDVMRNWQRLHALTDMEIRIEARNQKVVSSGLH